MSIVLENCRLPDGKWATITVEDGKIREVARPGSRSPKEKPILDAAGCTVLPGLVDSHCHPFEVGWLKRSVDLRGASNVTAIRLRLQAKVQRSRPGEWVVGRGWDHEVFPVPALPTRDDLDEVSPQNPVVLSRVCGHIALLNTRAVQMLGLEGARGAEYEVDGNGRFTGIVKEKALETVYSRIPKETEKTVADDLLSVDYEASRAGLTGLHCIISPESYKEELEAMAELDSAGSLSLRYRVYVPFEALDYVEEKKLRTRWKGKARINGVKLFADGSLGARTAALREPYSDDASSSGILRYSDEELSELVERADSKGYQVAVHAIGDAALEQAVQAISAVGGAKNPRRHRIEHASLAPKDLRSKMQRHSIGAAVQPSFITSDSWARQRLGDERAEDLYPLKSMMREGIVIAGSSDAPVETLSPIVGMWAAMTRADYGASERLEFGEALSLYTANASVLGIDDAGGRLEKGAGGDLVVLDSDVTGMHPAELRKVAIATTVVAGSVVYSYGGAAPDGE
jgi:predicted amidohydrolase YtcJ